MTKEKRSLIKFILTAKDLAKSVRRNISHDNKIDTQTISALNEFMIAANVIKDLTDMLERENQKIN